MYGLILMSVLIGFALLLVLRVMYKQDERIELKDNEKKLRERSNEKRNGVD